MQLGLGMVQQHFTLIPVFTALQNIVLAKEPRKFGALLDYQQAGEQITELAAQLGFDVPLNTPCRIPANWDTATHRDPESPLSRCRHPRHG